MFRHKFTAIMVLFVMCAISLPAQAQVNGTGSLRGRVFFDLQKGLSDTNDNLLTYRFRRFYFTYNMQISENVTGRFRVDAGKAAGGGHWVFVKHAYANWQVADDFSLRIGQQGTPLFIEIESVWNYRQISKTFHDQFGIRSSSDLGVSGAYVFNDMITVKAMMSNGEGYKGLDDDSGGKAYEFQGLITPLDGVLISAHFGLNGWDPDDDPDTDNMENTTTIDLSAGYEGDRFAVGGSYVSKSNNQATGLDGSGFWAFGRYNISNSPFSLLARYDSWDPDTNLDDDTMTYIIAGLDFAAAEGLNIIPNFQQTKDGSQDPVNEFLLTFYWRW